MNKAQFFLFFPEADFFRFTNNKPRSRSSSRSASRSRSKAKKSKPKGSHRPKRSLHHAYRLLAKNKKPHIHTSLKKSQVMKNKQGVYVSKKKHAHGLKLKSKVAAQVKADFKNGVPFKVKPRARGVSVKKYNAGVALITLRREKILRAAKLLKAGEHLPKPKIGRRAKSKKSKSKKAKKSKSKKSK